MSNETLGDLVPESERPQPAQAPEGSVDDSGGREMLTLTVVRGRFNEGYYYAVMSDDVPGLHLGGMDWAKVLADAAKAIPMLSDLNKHNPWRAHSYAALGAKP